TRHDQRRRLAHPCRTPEKGTGAFATAAGARQAGTQGGHTAFDCQPADRSHSAAAGAGYAESGFPLRQNWKVNHAPHFGLWLSRATTEEGGRGLVEVDSAFYI